jgi:hypothetical protein
MIQHMFLTVGAFSRNYMNNVLNSRNMNYIKIKVMALQGSEHIRKKQLLKLQ